MGICECSVYNGKVVFLELLKNPNTVDTWVFKKGMTCWSWFSRQCSRTKEYGIYFLCWMLLCVLLCNCVFRCTHLCPTLRIFHIFQSHLVYPLFPGISSWFTAFILVFFISCNFLAPQALFRLNYRDILSWNLKVTDSCPIWRLFQGLARNGSIFKTGFTFSCLVISMF